MRAIDADELKKCFSLTLHGKEVYNAEEILMTIQTAPTIEPAPTAFIPAFTITSTDGQAEVRLIPERHGKWIEHHKPYTWMGYTYWSCSECGFECGYEKDITIRTNCCPNCGALMDEVGE